MCEPFQKKGADFLSHRRYALLADSMGLGKTVQSIAALDMVKAKSVVIVCPGVARTNWKKELVKFKSQIDLTNLHVIESSKQLDQVMPGDSVILTYNLASKLPEYLRFDVAILDEAHFVKNRGTERTEILMFPPEERVGKHRRNPIPSLMQRVTRLWCLTGTPTPNDPVEMYVFTKAFRIHYLNRSAFIDYFFRVITSGFGGIVNLGVRDERKAEWDKMLHAFMLRRTPTDAEVTLPPLVFSSVYVEPDASIKLDAEETESAALAEGKLIEDIRGGRLEKALMNEAVNAGSLRRLYGTQKVKGAVRYIKELHDTGQFKKAIIFCHHRDVTEGVAKGLQGLGCEMIIGGMSRKDLDKSIDRFQSDPTCSAISASISMSNAAINLQAADTIVFVEMDWVPGNNSQAVGRAQRKGQKNSHINVVLIKLEGNEVDEAVIDTLKRKVEIVGRYFKEDVQTKLEYGA
jgi:SWI/SNF-related matrix-associated actin-dependent regulator 1 of chromatin subfamily A